MTVPRALKAGRRGAGQGLEGQPRRPAWLTPCANSGKRTRPSLEDPPECCFGLNELSDGGDIFNLFSYITFRAGGAFFTALIFGFMFGRPLINALRRKYAGGQPIREDGPAHHIETKAGTPTMGGLLILAALTCRRCSGRGSTIPMSGWCWA
jgi:hypothetical protein